MKLLRIENCSQCYYFDGWYTNPGGSSSKHYNNYCARENRVVRDIINPGENVPDSFPDWCPLEDTDETYDEAASQQAVQADAKQTTTGLCSKCGMPREIHRCYNSERQSGIKKGG